MRIRTLILTGAGAVALGGCAYGYGDYGYGGYGGYGGYDYGYNYPYYGADYGYGYGEPFGWYGDYYYPGVGFTVYDTHRRSRTWNTRERAYWGGRQRVGTRTTVAAPNWSGFNRRGHRH